MYRAVIVVALSGAAYAATTVPRSENGEKQEKSMAQQLSMLLGGPMPPAMQNNNRQTPPTMYYYPAYPEYVNNNNKVDYTKDRYAVQPGYEGYLIPSVTPTTQKDAQWLSGGLVSSLWPLLNSLIVYGARASTYLLNFLLVVLLGGIFTTLTCTFTAVCDITFSGLGISKNQVQELARTYITPEGLNTATLLVSQAIDKYASMQYERNKEIKPDVQTQAASDNTTEN